VGKLGQVVERAPVYAKPDKGAKILYRVDPQLYIVLKAVTGDWITLVMADGTSGYIEAKYVDVLPYEVNVKKPTTPPVATRGGFTRKESGAPVISGDSFGSGIVRMGMQYIGTPYVWGGNSLTGGIDCSGFVQQLFKAYGMNLPRTAQEQSYVGMLVNSVSDLQVGDRLYFTDSRGARVTHTGIYMGDNMFIHSSSGLGGIHTSTLTERWLKILVGIRR
jgi:cell wall-associated NlpC family hydrolase